jgi:formylglycine-generating enzyme required for sulfatase activity
MSLRKNERTTVFMSYSHQDTDWLKRLRVHLKPLERDYHIDIWDDTKILPGSKWREEIERAVRAARVAVLLITADFLASDFIASDELPPLLVAAEREGALILPVIVSPSRFLKTKTLSQFQAVNDPSRPLIDMSRGEQESVFVGVAESIENSLNHTPQISKDRNSAVPYPNTEHAGEHQSGTQSVSITDLADRQELSATSPPDDFDLPSGHRYIRNGEQRGIHCLVRESDEQVVLLLPSGGRGAKPFMIDKHLVTNSKYATFLNHPNIRALTYATQEGSVLAVITADQHILLGDACSHWESQRLVGEPWGLTYRNEQWEPLPGSGDLPVTLVTVLGASWYASWVRQFSLDSAREGCGLPTETQWETAARWDYDFGRLRTFPWGNTWHPSRLNSISYWAGRDVEKSDPEYDAWWTRARPTPVGSFVPGISPSGMMDAFGNVWEWLSDRSQLGQQMIKGGDCVSPQSRFQNPTHYRQSNFIGHTIGFRCCWQTS